MAGHIFRFLDLTGDGTGAKAANVDGSSAAKTFKYVPQTSDRTLLGRMLIHIGDAGPLSADNYGNITGPLTNGILVEVRKQSNDNTVLDLVDGLPIKNNSHWSRLCYDLDLDSFGSGVDFITVRWTFTRSGAPLYIGDDEYFCCVVQDDLTGLTDHTFMLQGITL